MRGRTTRRAPQATVGVAAPHAKRKDWPRISRHDVYNIQMALIRNHGYFARWVDVGPNKDPVIEVSDGIDDAAITIEVSPDGLSWLIRGHHKEPVSLPLSTRCDLIADAVVAKLRTPR